MKRISSPFIFIEKISFILYHNDMNKIQKTFLNHIPFKNKRTSQGWYNFNAVCCHHNGESRPDPKKRGNIMLTSEGGFIYHCYNCGFTTGWSPGAPVHKKMRDLLTWFGATKEEIGEIDLAVLKLDKNKLREFGSVQVQPIKLKPVNLPNHIINIEENIEKENNKDFIKTIEYIYDRNPLLFKIVDFFWSKDILFNMSKRFIIKAQYRNKTYGYVARWARNDKPKDSPKYINQVPGGFLFNADSLYKPNRKYVIVCEGVLDALCVDGVAVMNHTISPRQLLWLKETDKQIIIVPDKDEPGMNLVEQAIEHGWYVSLPEWGDGIKDIEEAVSKYGRLFVIDKIINSIEDDETTIKVRTTQWI